MSSNKETKTIMEFLSENPNVDVSKAWERCWGIQTNIIERVRERFEVAKHPSCRVEITLPLVSTLITAYLRVHLMLTLVNR
ncbi:MAG: hypothetical protein CM1200mP17_16990 [Woeseia sp.]|nr:MAG: hypothetical protein CM1200mP17_16990 [Woeseia sp.]